MVMAGGCVVMAGGCVVMVRGQWMPRRYQKELALITELAAYRGARTGAQPTVTSSAVRRCALGRACARFPKVTMQFSKCSHRSSV